MSFSCLGDKAIIVQSEDTGKDLASVLTLLNKQVRSTLKSLHKHMKRAMKLKMKLKMKMKMKLFFQVTFESGLQAFDQEGVQKVTALKDDLVKAQHAQSPAIIKRNDELVQR